MKMVLQKVSEAAVHINGELIASIGKGLLVFLGVTHTDTEGQADYLAEKLIHLRLFQDEQQKMNLSLVDIQGEALIVSQFTLYADCTSGRRPAFTKAAPPHIAEPLYQFFINKVRSKGIAVQTGQFGAEMAVSLVNDGPVTLLCESC